MSLKTISILGAGWLGEPLGEHLVSRGHIVKGSTTDPDKLDLLRAKHMQACLLRIEPGVELPRDFFECDVLFLNIPPGRRNPDVEHTFLPKMHLVREVMSQADTPFLIFASSTSVYPDLNRVVTERDAKLPGTASGNALLAAESLFLNDPGISTTVVRFAGLYGYTRQPGRFLAGQQNVSNPEAPVNLIHRDDCIGIVSRLAEQDIRGEVFNACSDEHPTRRRFYTWAAARQGLQPPTFDEAGQLSFKIVSNSKLKERLGYEFLYPDPMQEAP